MTPIPTIRTAQLHNHPRAAITRAALNDWGLIVVADDLAAVLEGEKNLQQMASASLAIIGQRRALMFTASIALMSPWLRSCRSTLTRAPRLAALSRYRSACRQASSRWVEHTASTGAAPLLI